MKKFLSLFFAFAWTMIAFAATETTVYFSAPEKWIGENTVKLNVELQKNVENGWSQMEMTKSTLTYNGNPVYIGTYTDVEDGVYTMQFQLWDAEDKWKGQDEVYNSAESLTPVAKYNGKMYVHGTGWTAAPTENGGDNPGQGEGGEQTEVTYTLVGSPTIFGSSWDTEDTGNDMVKGEDGNYTLTKENVHLSNPTYEYKMVVNHEWGAGQIPADNSNQSITIETAGIYNVTFTLDMKDYVLTAVPQLITADAGGQTETVYTMVGDADIFGSSWIITDTNNDMVKGADGNYTLEKANVHLNAQQYEYKMVVNHDWGAGQIPADNSNLSFTVKTAGTYNVTFTLDMKDYALAADVQLVKADEQEQPQTFTGYIQPGIWDADGAKYAAWVWKAGNDGQWTAFADAVDGAEENIYAIDVPAHIDSLIFVRFKPETETPSWETEIVGESEQYVWIWNRTGSYGTPKAENCRTFVITDWDKGLWCGQEEEQEEETSEFHVYLQGSWNNWEGLHECTLNEDTTAATLTMDHLGAGTYEYQIVVTVGKDEYHFANTGTMTRDNCTGWDFATDLGYGINAGLDADMDGAYTFNLVIDKAALAINVSVTYPDNGQGGEQTETIYTLAGSKDLFGTEWDLTNEANDMVATAEANIYSLTKENVHLNAGTHTFRVYADRDFKGYQVPADHDQELVIKQAGTYNVTFTLNTNEHTLDVVPELVKADEQEQPQTFTGFIQPGIWDADGAKYAAWVWKAGNEGQWTAFADAVDGAEENIYAIDVPAHIDSLIFVRFKPETEAPSWEWDDVSQDFAWIWNRTGSYGTPKAENCRTFVITDWDKGLWCGQEEEEEEETSEFHVYLQGSWNGWSGKHECTLNADTTQATLTMERLGMGTYEYQVVVTVGKDEYHFANKGTMTRDNCTGWDFATDLGYGVNAGLDADMDGAYTFNLVIDKAALAINVSVTYPDNGQEEQTTTVYFVNTENWETVYIYAWTGEGETFEENAPWPGIEMGKLRPLVNGHDVYAYDLDNKFSNIIFNGASDDKKTGNLTLSANAPYFYGSTWYAEIDDIPAEQQPELHVYLQGSWDNWELHEFTQNLQEDNATLALQLDPETYDFQIVLEYGGVQVYFYNTGTMTRDNCTGWNFDLVTEYGQNARLTADMTGSYTFTLTGDLDNNQVTLSVTYPDNQGSALEETSVSSELRKVMENGVLYIIRDGKKYNAQGAVVY